jgi:lipopolysaccharide/colanic/teichoic acid biosynthesis glycosyltransferase
LIKLDSKGPVFFQQVRVGKDGKLFKILKFRTMLDAKHWTGPSLSPKSDPRVTSLGAVLRRFKANELPQLINVLRGEMSFVGPRPELPEFVELYEEQERRILSARPGIVGPSQIHMRNEEELYADGVDPKEYYIKYILPMKIEMDLEYVRNRSFLKDIGYLFQGVRITVTGAVTRRHLFENAEQLALFFCDACICIFSYFLSYFLRVEGDFSAVHRAVFEQTLPYVIISRMFILMYFGLYSTLIRYMSFDVLIKIVKGVTFSSILITLLSFFLGARSHPRSVFAIDWFILVCLLSGYRLTFRAVGDHLRQRRNASKNRILIYGVGNMGELALRYAGMQGTGKVVAFVDDDPSKMRKSFQGVKILGNRHDIEALVRLYHIDNVVIAQNDMPTEDLEQIKSLCEKTNVRYEVFTLAK